MTRAARRYVLAGALLLGGTCVAAGTPGADFVLSKTGNVRSVASGGRVWQGHVDSDPGAVPPPGASTHHLAFDFESDDYFRRDNRGHFAVGLRGDARSDANGDGAPDLRGGGVVLGNVTEYPRHDDRDRELLGGRQLHPSAVGRTRAQERNAVSRRCQLPGRGRGHARTQDHLYALAAHGRRLDPHRDALGRRPHQSLSARSRRLVPRRSVQHPRLDVSRLQPPPVVELMGSEP